MPDNKSPVSFQLPDRRTIEAYVVELPNGAIVVRTKDELTKKPGR